MKKQFKEFRKIQFWIPQSIGIALGVLFIAVIVHGATTIGDNINTDGNLSVSTNATTSRLVVGSTNPSGFSLGAGDVFIGGHATVTQNLNIKGYASTSNLVLEDTGQNLGGLYDLYVSSGQLYFDAVQLGSSGGPGAWQSTFVGTALTPTSTSAGFYVLASSTVAANFRVDGNATTTQNLTVSGALSLGSNQPRSTTTMSIQDTYAFGDASASAIFIHPAALSSASTGIGLSSAYYGVYVQDNPAVASSTYALYAEGGHILQTAEQLKTKGRITDDDVVALAGATAVAIQGRYAYVASCTDDGVEVLDISSATGTPVHVGAITDGGTTELDCPYGIAVYGRYAYVAAATDDGIEILDISDPSRPSHIGALSDNATTELDGTAITKMGIVVRGRYAYVAAHTDDGVEILDISDPANPRHVGAITDDGTTRLDGAQGIYVSGRYAYVVSSVDSGLEILDISDPANPRHVGAVAVGSSTTDVVVVGKYAYVTSANNSTFYVFDVSNPLSPVQVGSLADNANTALDTPINLHIAGKYAYVTSNGEHGVEVVDISTPTNPRHVTAIFDNSLTTLTNATGIAMQGNRIYVTAQGGSGGIEVLEVTGLDVPAATIGSLVVSDIQTWKDVSIAGHLSAASGMYIGGPAHIAGSFSVGSSTGSLLHINTVNNTILIATSTSAETLAFNASRSLVVGGNTFINGNVTTTGQIVVGTPTGGGQGTGSINVSGDVYKNGTAYTNPDYVFDQYFIGSNNASYPGIVPLNELEQTLKELNQLPGITREPKGLFGRFDILLEKIEEAWIYIVQLFDTSQIQEQRIDELEKRIQKMEESKKEIEEAIKESRKMCVNDY